MGHVTYLFYCLLTKSFILLTQADACGIVILAPKV